LKNSVSFNYKNDLKLFAFLLPMEYVFEVSLLVTLNVTVRGAVPDVGAAENETPPVG